MTRKPYGVPSPREEGLRWLARSREKPEVNLQHALVLPHDPAKPAKRMAALRALVEGVSGVGPAGSTPEQRATALWRLIRKELDQVGVPEGHKRRTALRAALHLDPTNTAPSIDKRLAHARAENHFGSQQFGHDMLRMWWGSGVRQLGHAVHERLEYLSENPEQWLQHFEADRTDKEPALRPPSKGAQPVFLDLFVTTVFMKGRAVHRRITERLVKAQEDNVSHYMARALPGADANVIVRALWGCRAERLVSPPGEPVLTRLWFPTLPRGQQHWFSSEVIDQNPTGERRWINVEVDHHGIAPGQRLYDLFPISGLTIRIKFEEDDLPEAVWWYAELTERERYARPPDGDPRLLAVRANGVEYTFTQVCQPRESYGVSILWPAP